MSIDIENNKSICPYAWTHSYIGARYGKKLCCVSKNIAGHRKMTDDEFWNCQKMKDIRLAMLKGEPVDECETCYENESKGIKSLRQIVVKDYSYDSRFENLELITNSDGSTLEKISYFDYRTIYCNLQCISCGDIFSTKHIALAKKMYPDEISFKIDKEFEQKMTDSLISALDKKECTDVYWAGGEPLISKMHWTFIEKLQDLRNDPNTKEYANSINMHYNTNLTKVYWKDKLIPKMLQPNRPQIYASLDGAYETIEYCRDGVSWPKIRENWDIYHEHLQDNLGLSPILSAPFLLDIDRFFDFFEPYQSLMHTHRFLGNVTNLDKINDLLDIRLFPQNIVDRVLNRAIKKFTKTKFKLIGDTLNILNYLKKHPLNVNKKNLGDIKRKIMVRDKYLITNRSFGELLKIIDTEASDWYESIEIIKE